MHCETPAQTFFADLTGTPRYANSAVESWITGAPQWSPNPVIRAVNEIAYKHNTQPTDHSTPSTSSTFTPVDTHEARREATSQQAARGNHNDDNCSAGVGIGGFLAVAGVILMIVGFILIAQACQLNADKYAPPGAADEMMNKAFIVLFTGCGTGLLGGGICKASMTY